MLSAPHFVGRTVVVIGNGPSLSAFSPAQLRGHPLIAINAAGEWAAPVAAASDVLYFNDASWGLRSAGAIATWPGVVVTGARHDGLSDCVIALSLTDLTLAVSGDHGAMHASSGHSAAALAACWGAKRIILLGFDARVVAGRSHWHDDYAVQDGETYAGRFVPAWRDVADACRRLGAELVNATPDSAIEAVPLMPLGEAI